MVLALTVGSELLSRTVKSNCRLFSQKLSETNINLAKDNVAAALNFGFEEHRYYVTLRIYIYGLGT